MKIHPSTAEAKLGFDVLRERIDALTLSRLGQDRLAGMRPASSLDWLRTELERVAELQSAFRFDDPVPLDHVLDVRDVVRRAAPEDAYVGPEDLLAVRLVLGTLRRLRQYVGARREKYPRLEEAVGRIVPLPDLEDRIREVVDDEGRIRDDASPELRRLRQLIVRRQAQLRDALMAELRRAIGQGYATEEQPTIRNGRMVIPVRAEAKRKIQGFVQDTSSTGQTVYIEPAAVLDLNNEVRELEGDERREVERILRTVTARLRLHLDGVREGMRALAAFDLLQAKARFANEIDAIVPELNEDGVMDIRKGRNPVLLLHFRRQHEEGGGAPGTKREVVPLDLTLGDDFHTLVVTGPNAGGKTVAMKAVGLFALMLGYGLPLPVAHGSRACLFDTLMVDIGDEQSIEEDLSTFSSHVSNLKFMLRHATPRTLVLIDEAGTGTDPAEGGALAQAVLERLTQVGARTIVTTHHGTLKVFAHETGGVENGSMEFDRATLSPTYRFRTRVPGSSYAFDIARRIGLDPSLLTRAEALVGEQKAGLEELLSTFETRNRELDERLVAAEKALRQAEQERSQYEERLDRLNRERDELREKAVEEAEAIVRKANAQVERTIREIKEAQAEKETTQAARARLETFRESLAERRQKIEQRQARRAARSPAPAPAARKEARKEARKAQGNGRPSPTGGPIAVGDQVVLDGGSAAAEVIEIAGKEALVAFDSMKMRVKMNRLQKVGGPRKQQVTVRQVATSGGADLSALGARNRVDLRGQRVDEALAEVTRLIDAALQANLDRVEILHGKGTGALRQAIHEYLSARPEVASFDEAPPDQGGAGVTYVSLT